MACVIITVTDNTNGRPKVDVRMKSFPEMPIEADEGTPAQIVAWVMMDMVETFSKRQDAELPQVSVEDGRI